MCRSNSRPLGHRFEQAGHMHVPSPGEGTLHVGRLSTAAIVLVRTCCSVQIVYYGMAAPPQAPAFGRPQRWPAKSCVLLLTLTPVVCESLEQCFHPAPGPSTVILSPLPLPPSSRRSELPSIPLCSHRSQRLTESEDALGPAAVTAGGMCFIIACSCDTVRAKLRCIHPSVHDASAISCASSNPSPHPTPTPTETDGVA